MANAKISQIQIGDTIYDLKDPNGGGGGSATITNVNYTLLASGWSNGIYSLESIYPSSDYTILNVFMPTNITSAQRDALYDAEVYGVETLNQIVAHGTVPTIDIPVVLQFLGDVS